MLSALCNVVPAVAVEVVLASVVARVAMLSFGWRIVVCEGYLFQ